MTRGRLTPLSLLPISDTIMMHDNGYAMKLGIEIYLMGRIPTRPFSFVLLFFFLIRTRLLCSLSDLPKWFGEKTKIKKKIRKENKQINKQPEPIEKKEKENTYTGRSRTYANDILITTPTSIVNLFYLYSRNYRK